MWKDFFYYSRTEKKGIIVLVLLICVAALTGTGLHICHKRRTGQVAEFPTDEYQHFITSLEEHKPTKVSHTHHRIARSSFDPNIADSATFIQQGLPSWMVRNILRYRAKGGVFRDPKDFGKVYGLQKEQFAKLSPYIYISEQFQRHALPEREMAVSQPAVNPQHLSPDTLKRPFKYPAGTIIDINAADTAELQKIPGIGSVTARKIITYRKRLGGFYHVSQLHELGEEIGKLTAWFRAEESDTQRIDLNSASIERLKAHPYFNFYQAKAIVEYRKKRGKLKHLNQLSFFDEFTEADLERIKKYVKIDNN